MGSSSNWSIQKVMEAASIILNWLVQLSTVLSRFSYSNRASGNRRDNYKRRLRLQITLLFSTQSSIASWILLSIFGILQNNIQVRIVSTY